MREIRLFKGLTPLLHDEAVAKFCTIENFGPGAPILVKGESSTHICIVLEGEATAMISRNLEVPFMPGSSFGELSFVDGEPRSVRVIATGENATKIAILTREAMDRIRREDPELAQVITQNLLLTMARQVRSTDSAVQDMDVSLQRQLARKNPGLLERLSAVLG